MRITIAHGKTKQEATRVVDQSFDDLFRGLPIAPVQLTDQKRSWNGSLMTFSFKARMGFIQNPVTGTVEVTDRELTLDMNLGMLERLIPQAALRTAVESKFKSLPPASPT